MTADNLVETQSALALARRGQRDRLRRLTELRQEQRDLKLLLELGRREVGRLTMRLRRAAKD